LRTAYSRLGRLKEEVNMRQEARPSWHAMSSCTRGVAVAVSARSGSEGNCCLK
jgi:hypothetical protein